LSLSPVGVHVFTLVIIPGGQSPGKGTVMPVTSFGHLSHQAKVSQVQSPQFAAPSLGLRVVGISPLVFRQYCPDSVQFSVFTKEMLTTQLVGRYVPDPHEALQRDGAIGHNGILE
jgi:hypothetical protein